MGFLHPPAARLGSQSGASVIETMLVVAVVALLAAMAFPRAADMAARQRLRGAADNLRSDLVFARSEAIKRQGYVYVRFSPGSQWCYAVTLDPTCGCATACASPASLLRQTSSSEAAAGVAMTASFAGSFCGATECVRFEAFQGTAMGSNGTATFEAAEGSQYKVYVAPIGRARVCRYSGDSGGAAPECS
jgi:type IV fimbrial biogenesis protein FimT